MAEEIRESLIINKTIFNFLKNFGWSQVPKNRYVTLVFDMVSIKDVVPSMSKMENMPTHVLLFTIKVINGKGFQPIGNVFLYGNTPAWKLSDCIKAYICDLEKCELFVIATVCPPTEYLRSAIENLVGMSTLKNKTDAHIYNAGNVNNIIHIYDAPSMLREVRNCFIESPVTFKQFGEQCSGTYKDVKRILKTTTNESLKTILEMKDNEEVNEYAIKLFSMNMSRELQKPVNNDKTPHRGTANLCSFFDVLFDSFNGNADYDNLNRRSLSSFSPHNKIWRDAIPILKSMKFSTEPAQEEKNSSLPKKQNPQVLSDNVIDVSLISEAKRKQKKIKSTDQKIQEENSSDHDENDQMNKKVFSHAKQNKEKKIKVTDQLKHAGGNKLNRDISFDVKHDKQKKTKVTDQKIWKEHSDYKQAQNSENSNLNENVFRKITQPQNSDHKCSRIKQDEQKNIKATNQYILGENADESNLTGNVSPRVKQEKQKKIKETDQHMRNGHSDSNQHIQPQNSDNGNLKEKLSFCVKQDEQKKIETTNQHIQREDADESNLTGNISPRVKQEKQKKIKETDQHIQPQNSNNDNLNEKLSSCIKQDELKKIETTNQHIQGENADESNLTGNISPRVKQEKQKKIKETDQHMRNGHSDSNQYIQPQNSNNDNLNEKLSSCIKQDELRKIETTNQHGKQKKIKEIDEQIGTGHSDSNQHIQTQNSDESHLNEKISYIKQDAPKKKKSTNQHIQRKHGSNSTGNIPPHVKQDKQKKTNVTDQHIQKKLTENSHNCNLNEKISHIKQEKQKKNNQHIWSKHSNSIQHIEIGNSDDYNLTNDTSHINQKKTQITNQTDNSNDCSLNKNNFLHAKQDTQMETKTNNQHNRVEYSADKNLDAFSQDKKDKEKALNEVDFGNVDDNNLSKRNKQRKLNRKKQLVSNPIHPLPEKLNNHKLDDLYECTTSNHSNEILSEHRYANSMLEALNDTQYLDMVLENIDEDINDTSLIYKNSNKSLNGKEEQNLDLEMENSSEDKYKKYHKKLMRVLNQSTNFKGDADLNDSNETIAIPEVKENDNISTNMHKELHENVGVNESFSFEENKAKFVSPNVNSESGTVNKKKNCINKPISQENNNADSNSTFIKESENPNDVSGQNLNVETLKNCDLLHEDLLIGNCHRKNERKMDCEANTSQEAAKDISPTFEQPKIISQVVEQLQQKGMCDSSCCSDEISQDDNDSETLKNSINSNCVNESKIIEHPTSISNEHEVVEDKKNEGTHIQSKSMKKANRKPNTSKTSDILKEDKNCSSLPSKTNPRVISDEILSNICTTNSNSEENNLRDDEQFMDVTEEASDIATNDNDDDLNEKQNVRPYVLDAWIISINGMKEIYKTLQQKSFQSINTKEFNVDCVKYMLHMVKQNNGVDHPCPVEKENYKVLNKNLIECAFLPEASITLK